MDYLKELKAFYDRLELNPQPNTAIALWHALMSIANKAGWPDTFTVASSVLGLRSGLNASALKRARNKLATDGFIEWKPRGGNLSAQYKINSLVAQNRYKNEPQFEPQNEPQFALQCEPQSEPINKHKQKQRQENNITGACVRFEEFWNSYPKQTHRMLAEQAYCMLVSSGITEDALITASGNYAEYCNIKHTQQEFISHPDNWLNKSKWTDYTVENYKKPVPVKDGGKNKFNNFSQRNYDFDALEKQALRGQDSG